MPIFKNNIINQTVCLAINPGVGPALVVLVVLRWRTGSGGMTVIVLIAGRCGLSCGLGAAGAATAGSASVRDFGFVFFFPRLFSFQYLYYNIMYIL